MVGALISILIAALTAAVIGARTLALARRTRQLPELYVGVGLSAFALAQIVGLFLAMTEGKVSPATNHVIWALLGLSYNVTLTSVCLFTVEIFGRGLWRWILAVSLACTHFALRVRMVLLDINEGGADETITTLIFAFAFLWMGVEALWYHRKAERARRIGLASAFVVNRFLVFGIGGSIAGVLTIAIAAATHAAHVELERFLILTACLVNTVTWILTFIPPAAYRRFVEARAARQEASRA